MDESQRVFSAGIPAGNISGKLSGKRSNAHLLEESAGNVKRARRALAELVDELFEGQHPATNIKDVAERDCRTFAQILSETPAELESEAKQIREQIARLRELLGM